MRIGEVVYCTTRHRKQETRRRKKEDISEDGRHVGASYPASKRHEIKIQMMHAVRHVVTVPQFQRIDRRPQHIDTSP